MGEALFWNRRMYPVSCLLLGVLVLLESGLQRIIVLTVVYGNDLWQAINTFINGITGQTTLINYSYILVAGYVLVHLAAGILVGLLAGRLPQRIRLWSALHKDYLLTMDTNNSETMGVAASTKRKSKIRKRVIFIWLALLILYLQSSLDIGPALLPANIAFKIFIRSLLFILTFYFIVGPCLTSLINRWLQNRKVNENEIIQNILQFLPGTKQLVSKSWQLAAHHKGISRILLCGKIILLNTLHTAHD
jgi:hypothetical protein